MCPSSYFQQYVIGLLYNMKGILIDLYIIHVLRCICIPKLRYNTITLNVCVHLCATYVVTVSTFFFFILRLLSVAFVLCVTP